MNQGRAQPPLPRHPCSCPRRCLSVGRDLLLAALLCLVAPVHAQEAALAVGDHVRLSGKFLKPNPLYGDLVTISEKHITLLLSYGVDRGETLPFELAQVEKLEVQRRGESSYGRNALMGLWVGALVGAGLGVGAQAADTGLDEPTGALYIAALGGLGGLLGTLIGVMTGGPETEWEPVDLDRPPRSASRDAPGSPGRHKGGVREGSSSGGLHGS